jgi:hypothetical protein
VVTDQGSLAEHREVIAVDFPGHGRTPPVPGATTVASLADALEGFIVDERLEVEVDHLVADDDSVAFAYRVRGTHQGDFQGIAPTGRRIEARGLRIVERWGSSDEVGIMNQLGQG